MSAPGRIKFSLRPQPAVPSVQRPHGEDTTSGFCVPFHLALMCQKMQRVVWNPEISVQHLRAKFEIEYGTSIERFLNSAYLAGADLNGRTLSTARPLRPSVRYCEATFQGQPDCTGTVFPGTEIR